MNASQPGEPPLPSLNQPLASAWDRLPSGSRNGCIPGNLLFQWHITERCNLRCAHCYQDQAPAGELPLEELLAIHGQYLNLLGRWRTAGKRVRGHITVTGGEPFTYRDFGPLLECFASHLDSHSFGILTNGVLIDQPRARWLKKLRPAFVQASLDGLPETHDRLRGAGNFNEVLKGISHLRKAGIYTVASFTAQRSNFREFPKLVEMARRHGINRIWADRLIPAGNAAGWQDQMLDAEETREFFNLMLQARVEAASHWWFHTEVSMHRALQFLVGGGHPYHCTAGHSLLTVMPNGDVFPCRRLPILAGNLLKTPLPELYHDSPVLRQLRDETRLGENCQHCLHRAACRGGLKCLAYATTGNPFQGDPGCWLRQQPAGPERYQAGGRATSISNGTNCCSASLVSKKEAD